MNEDDYSQDFQSKKLRYEPESEQPPKVAQEDAGSSLNAVADMPDLYGILSALEIEE